MQLRHAALLQAVALSSIVLVAQSGGCAAGTTEDSTPTGPAVSAADTTTSTSSGKTSSTSQASSAASTSSAGGAGSSSSSVTASSAASTSASTSTTASVSASASSSSATSAVASSASSTASSSSGGCTLFGHTIVIDGQNDFTASETFATSSATYTGYVTWDAANLYLGMQGADVGSGDPHKFVVAYIGGAGGTTTGVLYNTQTPTLPFAAKWHLRWKADNTFTNALVWNGSSWVDAGWSFTGLVFQNGNYIELAIPRTNIGSPPGVVPIDVGMINEANGAEGTYAGVPSTAYSDGYNASFAKYFGFDLGGCNAPTTFLPLP